MNKPYYQDKYATIYLGDCRDIVPSLPTPDILLTDPPYGIDYQSARRTELQRKSKIIGDKQFPTWLFDLCQPKKASLIFLRWDVLPSLPAMPKSLIVWDKGNHSMGDLEHEYGREWEAIAFYPSAGHRFLERPKDIIRVARVPPMDLQHPNEKPVALLRQLLVVHEGQTILDPFMGVGTTLRAAKDLGRQAIGSEIEERYCEIAAQRLSQEVMVLD